MIQALAFSPDSRRLASAGVDRPSRSGISQQGQLVKSLADFRPFADDVAFLSDGKRLLTRCVSEIRIWDLDAGPSQAKPLQVWGGIAAVSANGNYLASIRASGFDAPSAADRTFRITVRDLHKEEQNREVTLDATEGGGPTAIG